MIQTSPGSQSAPIRQALLSLYPPAGDLLVQIDASGKTNDADDDVHVDHCRPGQHCTRNWMGAVS